MKASLKVQKVQVHEYDILLTNLQNMCAKTKYLIIRSFGPSGVKGQHSGFWLAGSLSGLDCTALGVKQEFRFRRLGCL